MCNPCLFQYASQGTHLIFLDLGQKTPDCIPVTLPELVNQHELVCFKNLTVYVANISTNLQHRIFPLGNE